MTATIYRSTDASAPVLTGTPGSIITLLTACLVSGYGSKTGAGWTKPFTGTNLAAFRMNTTGSTGYYLRVDDTAAQECRLVGYETMTNVSTGTNRFPTATQWSGGGYLCKSSTADSTARPWILIASNKSFYLFTYGEYDSVDNLGTSYSVYSDSMFFGDFISRKTTTDTYRCALFMWPTTRTTGTWTTSTFSSAVNVGSAVDISATACVVARPYTGLAGASAAGLAPLGYAATMSSTIGSPNEALFPDPVTGQLLFNKIGIVESSGALRGYMPGLYEPIGGCQPGVTHERFSTVTGTGTFAGRQLFIIPTHTPYWNASIAIDITGSWY